MEPHGFRLNFVANAKSSSMGSVLEREFSYALNPSNKEVQYLDKGKNAGQMLNIHGRIKT